MPGFYHQEKKRPSQSALHAADGWSPSARWRQAARDRRRHRFGPASSSPAARPVPMNQRLIPDKQLQLRLYAFGYPLQKRRRRNISTGITCLQSGSIVIANSILFRAFTKTNRLTKLGQWIPRRRSFFSLGLWISSTAPVFKGLDSG